MLEHVDNPFYVEGITPDDEKTVHRVFVLLNGKPDLKMKRLCNAMLVDWQGNLKLKKIKKDKTCPYYSPKTQNTELRIFMAYMKSVYDWQYETKDFFGYNGALVQVLAATYAQRQKEYVSYNLFIIISYEK